MNNNQNEIADIIDLNLDSGLSLAQATLCWNLTFFYRRISEQIIEIPSSLNMFKKENETTAIFMKTILENNLRS